MSSHEPLAEDAEQSRHAETDSLDFNPAPTQNGDNHTIIDTKLDVTIKFTKSDLKSKGSKTALIEGSSFFREHFEDVREPNLRATTRSRSKVPTDLTAPNSQNSHRAKDPPTRREHQA
jgi:hypothetical protein